MDFLQLLPKDIVFNHILNNFDFTTRVRAAAVCSAWKELFVTAPPTDDLPSIWFTYKQVDCDRDTNYHHLIDLASSTSRIASSHCRVPFELLFASRDSYLTFFAESGTNMDGQSIYYGTICCPFTGKSFELPCMYRNRAGIRHPLQFNTISGTAFSSKPLDCVVAAWSLFGHIYIHRLGDDDWIKGPRGAIWMFDMVFHKGQFYTMEGKHIAAYNIMHLVNHRDKHVGSTPWRRRVASCKSIVRRIKLKQLVIRSHYLVESGGELLVVTKINKKTYTTFMVHRVDEEKAVLKRVVDLGGRMLFVQREGSSVMSGYGPGATTNSDSFFAPNCIYFFHESVINGDVLYCLAKYQMETNSCEYHNQELYRFRYQPIWVTPPLPN